MPTIRMQSVADFRRQQEEELQSELSSADRAWEAALGLLRFLPPDKGLVDTYVDIQAEGVAAYYSEDTKGVTVLSRADSDPIDDVFVLSHEFVHSLQDEDVGLGAFFEAHTDSTDSSVSVRSLIEGEAMVVSFAVMERAFGRPPERARWEPFRRSLLAAMRDDLSASASPFLLGYQTIPYAYGFATLWEPWSSRVDRHLDDFYSSPRTALADIMADSPIGASVVAPLTCYPTEPPPGFVAQDHDSFGILGIISHEGEIADPGGQDPMWRGDSVVTFRSEADSASYAVAWTVRWQDTAFAGVFASRIRSAVPDARVVLRANEVDVLVATDPAIVVDWSPGCGSKDSLPATSSGGTEENASRLTKLLGRLQPR